MNGSENNFVSVNNSGSSYARGNSFERESSYVNSLPGNAFVNVKRSNNNCCVSGFDSKNKNGFTNVRL